MNSWLVFVCFASFATLLSEVDKILAISMGILFITNPSNIDIIAMTVHISCAHRNPEGYTHGHRAIHANTG